MNCPIDRFAERSKMNLSGLYPLESKFLVYSHAGCCLVWIRKGSWVGEPSNCPMCQTVMLEAINGFSDEAAALNYKAFLEFKNKEDLKTEKMFLHLNAEINKIESGKPSVVIPEKWAKTRNGEPYMDGSFYEKWLGWKVQWPVPEMIGVNQYRNATRTLPFGPGPSEWTIGEGLKKKNND
ncbi:unnamed protein product [Caenorhabditis sp. 36 PRJEB53466]|nr:unnamed protein product [Caenorhabditis sp. 36 PRJEB53466]